MFSKHLPILRAKLVHRHVRCLPEKLQYQSLYTMSFFVFVTKEEVTSQRLVTSSLDN